VIYLELFLQFLKIGAVSFGGGYGMLAIIKETVLAHGWLTESELLNFIAVSESTPGPIAVNMATFIGSSQGGVLGAVLATLGVVLPAFIIMLMISMLLMRYIKKAGVGAAMNGVRPVVAGLIIATAVTLLLTVAFGIKTIADAPDTFAFGWREALIFVLVAAGATLYKKIKKKALSPIILILFSGIIGLLLYIPQWI